jgi:hypothetical protein
MAPAYWSARLQNPLFVVGVARSGTTLVNDILAFHRDIAVLSEANDIWDPYGYPWNASNHTFPPDWVDSKAYVERWWQEAQPRQQEIRAVFGAYQVIRRKRYFLNKSPMNTNRIAYLLEIFPDARFIHIIRDGRAVVRSFMQKILPKIQASPESYKAYGVNPSNAEVALKLAEFWSSSLIDVQQADQDFGLSKSGRLFKLTYENLCADMRGTIRALCDAIGLDFNRFDEKVWQTPVANQNHKWRGAYSDELLSKLLQQMQPHLQDYGYQDDTG